MRTSERLLISSLLLFFLSGCYSQLRYSEAVHPLETHRAWQPGADSAHIENSYAADRAKGYRNAIENFPYYFKDYDAAQWYAQFGFKQSHYKYGYFPNFYDPFFARHIPFRLTIIPLNSWYSRYPETSYYTSSSFGPWVCWDPWDDPDLYYYPGKYSNASIFVGFGHGYGHSGIYSPVGRPNYTGKVRTYGRRTTGTNRVKANQDRQKRTVFEYMLRGVINSNARTGSTKIHDANLDGRTRTGTKVKRSAGRHAKDQSSRDRNRNN